MLNRSRFIILIITLVIANILLLSKADNKRDVEIDDLCKDQHERCEYWANMGECDKNPNYMLDKCAKSCKECSVSSSESVETVTETDLGIDQDLSNDKLGKDETKTHTNDNNDVKTFCEEDVDDKMLCTRISDLEIIDPCEDQHERCEFWANEGECDINPNYMLDKCAKSCKECTVSSSERDKKVEKNYFGIDQELFGENIDKDETRARIETMKDYGKWLMKQESTTKTMRKLCTNELNNCAYYATKGLCETKVIFMMENCPLACMMCDKKEQFDACVGMRHPFSEPIFVTDEKKENMLNEDEETKVTHSIHSFFETIKKNDHSSPFEFEFLVEPNSNQDPWILRLGNFLSNEECNSIIDLGHTLGWTNSTSNVSNEAPKKLKKQKELLESSNTAKCSDFMNACNSHSVLSSVIKKLSLLTQIPLKYFEPAELKLYPESNGYHTFHHANNVHDNWLMAGPRVLSINIPLSNVGKGGYLGFPALDWLMVPPSAGQLVLWPNVLSKDTEIFDERMGREVLPVQGGDLYVLQLHVRLFDYEVATSRGCA